VRDITLTVDQGELVAIIGGSRSGKTTLLDAMSGLHPPTSGTVLRDAQGEGRPGTGPRARPIGYIPNADTIDSVLPLARALRYTAALRGMRGFRGAPGGVPPGDDSEQAVTEALDSVGLTAEAAVPVGALAPGGRKRAAIAAELLPRSAQLFLDEPTAGLDPAQATEVLRLLRRLSSSGMTVVLTTSSPLDAARCDKVAVLANGGHLAFFGTPAAARGYFGADSLEEIYERLAGLGDPAAAWSRRFFQLPRTRAGSTQVPTTPRAPGPTVLVPDAAGPHSAGRPGPAFLDGLDDGDEADAEEDEPAFVTSVTEEGFPDGPGRGRSRGPLPPAGQLPVLIRPSW
jgi:ABC-type multidrug transport system ATPase subunit